LTRRSCPERLAVIGGGYVGLHDAVLAARRGVGEVIVVDVDRRVVEALRSGDPGRLHIKDYYIQEHWGEVRESIKATTRYSDARGSEAFIVAVQTPLRGGSIDYTPLRLAAQKLPEALEPGALVASETTIYPGGTLELLGEPIARATGYKLDHDLLIAHAPERINPGDRTWTPERIPRILGAVGPRSLEAALRLYRDCLGLRVYPVSDIRVAEASKLLENAYRFLNISFVNELKRAFDRIGIDVREVVEAAATKPFGYMPFRPGPYAGGPCIPKDARMLEEATGSLLLRIARYVNETQPLYYAALVLREARRRTARRILFYGLGYKPDSCNAVESPVTRVMEALRELDPALEVAGYDPCIPGESDFQSEREALEWADLIVRWGYRNRELPRPERILQLEDL
jgi:nucleotide sugar dehydrogenase